MERRKFIRNTVIATSAFAFMPYSNLLANPLAGKVKITDVKCVRTKIGMRVSPLVKIITDAGLVGIGECHHDENGLGAKDIVLNVCKPILMGKDPLDLEIPCFQDEYPNFLLRWKSWNCDTCNNRSRICHVGSYRKNCRTTRTQNTRWWQSCKRSAGLCFLTSPKHA